MVDDTAPYIDGLTPSQILALEALAKGSTRQKASEHAGVSLATVFNWLRLPEFKEALRDLKSEQWDVLKSQLREGFEVGFRTLILYADHESDIEGLKPTHHLRASISLTANMWKQLEIEKMQHISELKDALESAQENAYQ